MIIDTSAIVSIVDEEPGSQLVVSLLKSASVLRMSAGTWQELFIVIDSRRSAVLSGRVERLLADLDVTIEPVTPEHAAIGRQAYRDFGKGRHAARLNYGDCFAYSLAKQLREPILFVGNDFSQTDIESAQAGEKDS